MAGDDAKKNGSSDSGFIKAVLGAGSLITAWIFVVGWTYLYAYYQLFGLNINSLGFPVSHYLVFCFTQFVTFGWQGVILGLLLLAIFLVTWAGTVTKRKLVAVLVGVIYLLFFWLGFRIAKQDAREAALQHMGRGSSLPLVSFELKPMGKYEYAAIEEDLGSANLRLLLESGDRLFVFVPVDTAAPVVRVRVLEFDRRDAWISLRMTRVK